MSIFLVPKILRNTAWRRKIFGIFFNENLVGIPELLVENYGSNCNRLGAICSRKTDVTKMEARLNGYQKRRICNTDKERMYDGNKNNPGDAGGEKEPPVF